ncbi:metallophosphoesterase [Corticibacter populi]|uniref:Metallophosphoesterase n=1 Tax=Corticibacter populi TaxID=1550736 RepID=A0A3M6QTY6_9BURK|nr:metallophosphoesterase [Corticibacter populi]RMX06433.1 metallophosphoesterase [Corticibacter populi]RZS32018.1 calcineurin-like phosphoesterase family protein [Corticibacter populi]
MPSTTAPASSLIQPLPEGPLDIVGDVHGEWGALQALLAHLGYDRQGHHPQGRRLVFVGDLCDRGPDTPAVMDWFCDALAAGHCLAVLGNHEVNLIREDAKDGAGWYFSERFERDQVKYAPFAVATPAQRQRYVEVCQQLPMALERPDLRVVHAAWHEPEISRARQLPLGSALQNYDAFETDAARLARDGDLLARMQAEKQRWPFDLEDGAEHPPLLPAHGERELLKQMRNPLKVLTTGVEQAAAAPFYAGGKWRFTERVAWWNAYDEATPVVIGHYWRRFVLPASQPVPGTGMSMTGNTEAALFAGLPGTRWHGKRHNVFCVDFSVGARWSERLRGITNPAQSQMHLAAMRWPERTLVLDNGQQYPTTTA